MPRGYKVNVLHCVLAKLALAIRAADIDEDVINVNLVKMLT